MIYCRIINVNLKLEVSVMLMHFIHYFRQISFIITTSNFQ